MGLIRTTLFLCGAAALMPSPPDHLANTGPANGAEPSTIAMLGAATSAVADVRGFCDRQPTVCDTASYVAWKLEGKVKYSAKLIYEWANESQSPPALRQTTIIADSDPIETGSTRLAGLDTSSSQSTLVIEDLIPEWRDPLPPKKG
jgi:hypothetical protein